MTLKILSSASVVLLGAGLAVAQCTANPQSTSTQSTTASVTRDTRTPSAFNPQTSSPDSISRWNPVSGQNPDSQRNPNAVTSVAVVTSPAPSVPATPVAQPQKGSSDEPSSTTTTTTSSDGSTSASNAQ